MREGSSDLRGVKLPRLISQKVSYALLYFFILFQQTYIKNYLQQNRLLDFLMTKSILVKKIFFRSKRYDIVMDDPLNHL